MLPQWDFGILVERRFKGMDVTMKPERSLNYFFSIADQMIYFNAVC